MNTRMRDWRAADGELPMAGVHSLAERTFRQGDIPSVRHFAVEFGARLGMRSVRLSDFVLAVSEAAACTVAGGLSHHGPGRQDEAEGLRRRLLHRLCDYASVSAGPDGVTVLASLSVS